MVLVYNHLATTCVLTYFFMALQSEAQWQEFFKTAGITDETASSTYAKLFTDNGFNQNSLPQLDKATLTELGITLLGHKLAILQCATKHNTPTTPSSTLTKASVNAQLTTLTLEMNHQQFRKFQQDWVVFKQITHIQIGELTAHLYNACNEEVKMAIINTHPDFLTLNEGDALKVLEPIVTVGSNPAVHRKAFGELLQEENQTIKNFIVRLRSVATDCAFQCPNPDCKHDLSSINIKDQFIRGLNNSVLQAEILAKTNQLTALEDVIDYAESFETALRDQNMLSNNNNINPTDTAYKFGKKKQSYKQPSQHRPCNGCGEESHDRPAKCKAWGKDCNNCGKPNHFASVCRQKGPLRDAPQG